MQNTLRTLALLLALGMLMCCTACTADNTIATTDTELAAPAVDTSILTVDCLEQLTWEELLELDWVPESDEDRCLSELIANLQEMGQIFRPSLACTTGETTVEKPESFDLSRFNKKVGIILEAFNTSPSTFWYMDTISVSPGYDFFHIRLTDIKMEIRAERFDLKYPVSELGELVVAISDVHCYTSPESFGKFFNYCPKDCTNPGHTIKAGDIFVVNGVAMMATGFDIKTSTYVEFDELYDADDPIVVSYPVVHMEHITTTDGTALNWVYPAYFIPLDVVEEYLPLNE